MLFTKAREALRPLFDQIDQQTKQNLAKVLDSYHAFGVGAHHFAGVSGYGHSDSGRDTLDQVFAQIVGAEKAAVRVQMVSGTHAIACALFGVLRPGDELLAVAGHPYDTLEEVIGLRGVGQGSLAEWGIRYRELDLKPDGTIDFEGLAVAISPQTKMISIQRSCGYSWRKSLTVQEIGEVVRIVKQVKPEVVCFVDNCYGEFVEALEPTQVGVDLMAGSLIKNPGGTIAPVGGYVAGRSALVEQACCRLTAPGIGSEGGSSMDQNRLLFQGLFLAPQMVAEAVKGAHLAAWIFEHLDYTVKPGPFEPRTDVIQAIHLGSAEKLVRFCRAIQQRSPVGSYLDPVPDAVPGYEDAVVMAGGTFIEDSTLELSADGPLREPYIAFLQGGTHLAHMELALERVLELFETPLQPSKEECQ